MPIREYADKIEALYQRLNRRRYVHPDPLEFLYRYDSPLDREVVGLVASALAYGRVRQILKSVSAVLDRLGRDPAQCLADASCARLRRMFGDFRHRFATGGNVSAMLIGAGGVIRRHGSLGACLVGAVGADDRTVLPALRVFRAELDAAAGGRCGHLLPDPAKGGACKRLNLMLRWMVRSDRVDPGGWGAVSPARLIVPLDTHMHGIGLALGATRRKSADMRTAMEITDAFRRICPDDPVKYDFALTRLGIREDMDISELLNRAGNLS